MADEVAMRKPGWQPGVPIMLADGNTWHFPELHVGFKVVLGQDGKPRARRSTDHLGVGYADLVDSLVDVKDDEEYFTNLMAMTIPLLRENYDVPDEVIPELFEYDNRRPELMETWGKLRLLAVGLAKKPSATGSSPPL